MNRKNWVMTIIAAAILVLCTLADTWLIAPVFKTRFAIIGTICWVFVFCFMAWFSNKSKNRK